MKRHEALNYFMKVITEKNLKPVVDKASTMTHKAIPVNYDLYENDYAEYIAKKQGKLVHITKDNK